MLFYFSVTIVELVLAPKLLSKEFLHTDLAIKLCHEKEEKKTNQQHDCEQFFFKRFYINVKFLLGKNGDSTFILNGPLYWNL